MSTYTDASLIVTPNAYKAGKLYSLKPTDGSGDLDVVRATTATYVGSDGLIKTALANEVRFDYTNGSCPSILVEPQRTNLNLYSEEFDNNAWSKLAGASIVTNTIISPSGTMTADTLNFDTQIGSRVEQSISLTTLGSYTFSFYAKSDSLKTVGIRTGISGSATINVQVTTEWQRFSVTQTLSVAGLAYPQIRSIDALGGSIYVWGAQLEAGANATSYIPTVASAVTRNADVISKSGISSLIGQTEGTVFCDVNLTFLNNSINRVIANLYVNDADFNNVIRFRVSGANFSYDIRNSGVTQSAINSIVPSIGRYKLAIIYKNNYAAFFINGVKIGEDLSVSIPNGLNIIRLGAFNSSGGESFSDYINYALVLPIALTDQECIELTTL